MSDFVKMALNPAVMAGMTRSIKGFGSGAGMGGAVGGVLGGAVGAAKGYQQARSEGRSPVQSLGGGLAGAARGAAKGAVVGAAAGGVAGAARPAYADALAPYLRGSSNFGQRQVHALTGVGDAGYLRSIGGGAADAEKRVGRAIQAHEAHSAARSTAAAPATRELDQARQGFAASRKAEQMGLYSIPGYAKSLAHDPVGTLRAGARDQWQNLGTGGRALMYGLPAVGVASELAKDESGESGQGRFERAGRLLGGAASGMLAPLALAGDVAAGGALSGGFGRVGRVIDRRRRAAPPAAAPAPDPTEGSTQAEGHIVSDRAAGVVPEGIQ